MAGTYYFYIFSNMAIFLSLATLLHLQFGRTGIVNFGIVGFFGLGMYSFGIFLVQLEIPFLIGLVMATALTGLMAFLLGLVILRLGPQEVLVATLAFAAILGDLVIVQKDITRGVLGLGSVPFPFDAGLYSQLVFFFIVLVIAVLLILYAARLEKSPYGRLLMSIQDDEQLAQSLGKHTFRHKLWFFTITSTAMGFMGVLYASNIHFLVPRMMAPGLTFTIWIALIIGGKTKVLGGLVGILITVGLFDFVIESFVPIPRAHAQKLPVIKMMVYGLTLALVFLFKPEGLLGGKKRRKSTG